MAPRKTPAASSGTISKRPEPPPPDPARVEQALKWILTGARDADIVEAISTTWPEQALGPLLAAAMQSLAASAETDNAVVRGFCFEATKDLYRRMVEIGDFAGALRAIKQLHELAG